MRKRAPKIIKLINKETEAFLKTVKGTCFLCRSQNDPNAKDAQISAVASLRNICRYLKVDPRLIPPRKICTGNSEGKWEFDDFKDPLCSECAAVMKSISGLICQMDMIKILITHELQVFHEIINESTKKFESQWSALQKRKLRCGPASSKELRLVQVVEDLRQETREKCSVKIKRLLGTSFPNILLERVKPEDYKSKVQKAVDNDKTLQTPKNISVPSKKKTALPPSRPKSGRISKKPRKGNYTSTPAKILSSTTSVIQNESQMVRKICLRYIKKLDSGNLCCTICDRVFVKNTVKLSAHVVNCHPEIFFADKRPISLSVESFKDHCQQFLTSETCRARRPSDELGLVSAFYCGLCNRKFRFSNDFKYHLVSEHYKIVKDIKLLRFERNESTPRTTSTENSKACHADPSASSIPKLAPRKVIRCLRNKKIWPCGVGGRGRGRALRTKVDQISHKKDHCSLIKSRTGKRRTCAKILTMKKKKTKETSPLPTNQVEFHGSPETVFAKYCGEETDTEISKKLPGRVRYRCLVCERSGHDKSVIKKHLVSVHPEKFFAARRKPELDSEELRNCCRDLMRLEWQAAGNEALDSKTVGPKLCSYCGWKGRDGPCLKLHLIQEHFQILQGKLNQLQELRETILQKRKSEGGEIANAFVGESKGLLGPAGVKIEKKRKTSENELNGAVHGDTFNCGTVAVPAKVRPTIQSIGVRLKKKALRRAKSTGVIRRTKHAGMQSSQRGQSLASRSEHEQIYANPCILNWEAVANIANSNETVHAPNEEAIIDVHIEEATIHAPNEEVIMDVHIEEATIHDPDTEAPFCVLNEEETVYAPCEEATVYAPCEVTTVSVLNEEAIVGLPNEEMVIDILNEEATSVVPNEEVIFSTSNEESTSFLSHKVNANIPITERTISTLIEESPVTITTEEPIPTISSEETNTHQVSENQHLPGPPYLNLEDVLPQDDVEMLELEQLLTNNMEDVEIYAGNSQIHFDNLDLNSEEILPI